MKMSNSLKLKVCTLVAMVFVSDFASAAMRQCNGRIYGGWSGETVQFADFTTRGNGFTNTRARNAARDMVARCGFDMYAARWDLLGANNLNQTPGSCRHDNAWGITFSELDIKRAIVAQSCARWRRFIDQRPEGIGLFINVRSEGDRGCGDRRNTSHEWTLSSNYRITSSMCDLGY